MTRPVFVNEAFRPQRVSGQQRYASEISDRLDPAVRRIAPGRFFSAGALRTWLWVQTVLPLRTWRGVLVSLTARAPLYHPRHLMVVHDQFVLEHPEWFSRRFQVTHALLLRAQLATAKCFAAVSSPVADQLRLTRPGAMVVVAPNAPSAAFAAREMDHGSGMHRGSADDPRGPIGDLPAMVVAGHVLPRGHYLLVVGNLDPRKNLARLAAAYGRLPAADRSAMPLVVVGGGADIYRWQEVDWPEGVVLTGYVDDVDLRRLYAGARAVVFPSLAEGFGLPLVEAVAAGAQRLLVSDIPVFRWICGDGAVFVDPLSVDELAAALQPDRIAAIPSPDPAVGSRFDWNASAATVAAAARRLAMPPGSAGTPSTVPAGHARPSVRAGRGDGR